MSLAVDALSWLSLVAGGFLVLVGGIGLVRMPDLFTRMHAASVTDTMGAALMLLGMSLQAGLGQTTIKLAIILVFLLVSSPTATHALAKAALHGKVEPLLHHGREEEPPSTS